MDTHLSSIFLSPVNDQRSITNNNDNGNFYFNENSRYELILIELEMEILINSNFNFFFIRKRSLIDDSIDTDLDNTRDSVLSGETFNDCCDPELMIIDFEYCAYNYRGFDLANHFLEWTFDYTNPEFPHYYHKKEQYPNREQKVLFFVFIISKCFL